MITNKLKIRKQNLSCLDLHNRGVLSGLSVNVGESQIKQVRDLGVKFNQFLNFYHNITALMWNHILETMGKLRICYCIMLVLQLFIPPISRDCSNTFLRVHSFMLIHANGTNWVNILKCQMLIVL